MFNQSQRRLTKQPIEPRRNTRTGRQVQENARQNVTIGNGLTSDWLRKRRENFLADHKRCRYLKQPLMTRRKFTYCEPNAGKLMWPKHDRLWAYFWLVDKEAQEVFKPITEGASIPTKNYNSKKIHVLGVRRGETHVNKSRLAVGLLLIGWKSSMRIL